MGDWFVEAWMSPLGGEAVKIVWLLLLHHRRRLDRLLRRLRCAAGGGTPAAVPGQPSPAHAHQGSGPVSWDGSSEGGGLRLVHDVLLFIFVHLPMADRLTARRGRDGRSLSMSPKSDDFVDKSRRNQKLRGISHKNT